MESMEPSLIKLRTVRPEPMRAAPRMDGVEPTWAKPNALSADPQRPKARNDEDDPACAKPNRESAEPHLPKPRKDELEPMREKASTDEDLPIRNCVRSETLLAKKILFIQLNVSPFAIKFQPHTEKPLPMRKKLRGDNDDARFCEPN